MKGNVLNMQVVKYFMLFLVLLSSSLIGKFISRKYVYRLQELEDMKNALNIFKTKIRFTYEPIPQIFNEISNSLNNNVGKIFEIAKNNMVNLSASLAWENAIDESVGNLNYEDKKVLKGLSKLLGVTDVDGQISQIDVTQDFLEKQIKEAR